MGIKRDSRGNETRSHLKWKGKSEQGRSTCFIECPFCYADVEAYIWSLAGGGKRCDCGVMHLWGSTCDDKNIYGNKIEIKHPKGKL